MLSNPKDFAMIQERGISRSHPLFSARVLRTDLTETRFAFATSRRLGTAVVRNRIRRRLREALRAMAGTLQPGWDVLIVVRPSMIEADHRTMTEALRRLLGRAGVIGGPG
jgi:ribonuclease P protein component